MSSSDYSAYDIEKLVTNNDPILSISKKLSLEEVDIWQGWILRKTRSIWTPWVRRYCIIRNCAIEIYANDTAKKLLGAINFNAVSI